MVWQSGLKGATMPAVPIEQVYEQIRAFAAARGVGRVVLFGSRARGDNLPKSDIDLAVYGGGDFDGFYDDVQERLWSLLCVDVVDMDRPHSPTLDAEIARDGKVLYEEVR